MESLAGVTLKDPERIVLTSNEDGIQEKFAVPESLSLNVAVIPPKQRLVLLVASVLKTNKSLVFVNTMAEVNFLHEVLTHMDLPRKVKRTFFRLHGDMEQAERVENFTQFQKTDKGNKEPCSRSSQPLLTIPGKLIQIFPQNIFSLRRLRSISGKNQPIFIRDFNFPVMG